MQRIWTEVHHPNVPRRLTLGVAMLGLLASSACSTLRVSSLPAPEAWLEGRTTFRIIERETVQEVAFTRYPTEVMLNNTIVDQIVADDIRRQFEARGYVMTDRDPDFEVAFYTRAAEVVEFENVDYRRSYPYRYPDFYVDQFTEGTVVIDVLDPRTDRLLWRASGVARVSDDPQKYVRQLREAVSEMMEEFPAATRPAYVAPRPAYERPVDDYGEEI